jgi:two-component system sensor histidine kinase QseC
MRSVIPHDRIHSLRWRLLAAIGAVVMTTWLLTGWFSYTKAQHEAEELMDGSLAQTARMLLAIIHDNEDNLIELAGRLATVRGAEDIYEPPLEFQIGRGDGSILARSLDAPELPILGVPGYSDIIRHDESWRVLNAASNDGRYRVQVAQSIGLRDRAALEVAVQTVLPLVLIVPLLILFIYLSITRALRPLERLAGEVAARTPDNLAALPEQRIPTEALPLIKAINRLFVRVGRTLDNERRFTADAAHELRTPLAALKVQAQVALLGGDTPARERALRQIGLGVDRAGHLIDQLLRLARLDPLNAPPENQAIDPRRLIDDCVAAIAQAHPESARIHVELPETPQAIMGDASLLDIALRNLLDNALRYTPADSTIRITLRQSGASSHLQVSDNGPGVPASALERLGERFFRAGQAAGNGNGLGLAIVARIAELHGATLSAENLPEGGFAVTLLGLRTTTRIPA